MEKSFFRVKGMDVAALTMCENTVLTANAAAGATSTAGRSEALTVDVARARELLPSVCVSLSSVPRLNRPQKRARARGAGYAETPATKPKKKRVRREKVELDYLRGLVRKLEQQMAELKAHASTGHRQCTLQPSDLKLGTIGYAATATNTTQVEPITTALAWQAVAHRQLLARARSEKKNRELRLSLEGKLELVRKLECLLSKTPADEGTVAPSEKATTKKPVTRTDDEIFAEQLVHVERAHLDVDRVFQDPGMSSQAQPFSNIFVNASCTKGTSVVFETKNGEFVPFDLAATSHAVWRALAVEVVEKHSYVHEARTHQPNLIVWSFALHYNVGVFDVNFRCKQTVRRFVEKNRVVIVWKSVMEPTELNGVRFHGVECNQTAWVVLNKMDPPVAYTEANMGGTGELRSVPMASTYGQAYSHTTMELKDDIVDQDFQLGTLTDFVVGTHGTVVAMCRTMVQDFLVHEDLNGNGWLDGLAL